MIKPENIYINPRGIVSTETFSGDYKNDKAVYGFIITVIDGICQNVEWNNEHPENIIDVENLIRIKFNSR